MIIPFAPKIAIGSAVVALMGGGATIYYYKLEPLTIKDKLVMEGNKGFDNDYEYKAIFYDQRELIKETIDTLKEEKDPEKAQKQIKEWCEKETREELKGVITGDKMQKILALCTPKGIHTVKGMISKQVDGTWIEDVDDEKEKTELYKDIFAIYRYDETFDTWLNVTEADIPAEKYSTLKKKCNEALNSKYDSPEHTDKYQYYDWWCRPLSYKNIQERIQHVDPTWEPRVDFEGIDTQWNNSADVLKWIKDVKSSYPPNKDNYENWCKVNLAYRPGHDKNMYMEVYNVIKKVCVKSKSQ